MNSNLWIIILSMLIIINELRHVIINYNKDKIKLINDEYEGMKNIFDNKFIFKLGIAVNLIFAIIYLSYYFTTSNQNTILIPFAIILGITYIYKTINILYKIKSSKVLLKERNMKWFELLNIAYATIVISFVVNVL